MPQAQFRKAAPNLYRALLIFAVINTAMGLNFMTLNPTVDPFGIPKEASGVVFLIAGAGQLLGLHLARSLRLQRVIMATAITVMSAWGGILFAASFVEKVTSLQLPITVFGLAYLGLTFLFTTPRKEPL